MSAAAGLVAVVGFGCLGEDVTPSGLGDVDAGGSADGGGGGAVDGGGTTDAETADAGENQLTLLPARPRVARGAQGSAQLSVKRAGAPTELAVDVNGLPSFVTATAPAIPASKDATTIGFAVKDDAGVGFFPFSIATPGAKALASIFVVPGAPSASDTAFDGDGVLLDLTVGTYNAVLVLPDGSVVVAGASALAGGTWSVKRYDEAGKLDETWSGKSVGKMPTSNAPRALARDATSGKIYVVGSSTSNAELLTIVRLNPDGAVDDGYANAGTYRATTIEHSQGSRGNAAAVLPDGKLVVAGRKNPFGLVARYTTAGQVDDTFTQYVSANNVELFGLAVVPSSASLSGGRILATGTDATASPPAQAAVRLTVDGPVDSGFGGGVRTYASGCRGAGFALTSDGAGVIVGQDVTAPSLCTTRFAASGGGDLAWTKKTSAGSNGNFFAAAAFAGGKGSYSAGEAGGSQDRYGLVVRHDEAGNLDATWGTGGTFQIEDPAVPDVYRFVFRGAASAPDGRLVLVGSRTSGGTPSGFVMRLWE